MNTLLNKILSVPDPKCISLALTGAGSLLDPDICKKSPSAYDNHLNVKLLPFTNTSWKRFVAVPKLYELSVGIIFPV